MLQARPAVGGLSRCASAALQEHDGRAQGILRVIWVRTGRAAPWRRAPRAPGAACGRRRARASAARSTRAPCPPHAPRSGTFAVDGLARPAAARPGRGTREHHGSAALHRHALAWRACICDACAPGKPQRQNKLHQSRQCCACTNPYRSHSVRLPNISRTHPTTCNNSDCECQAVPPYTFPRQSLHRTR